MGDRRGMEKTNLGYWRVNIHKFGVNSLFPRSNCSDHLFCLMNGRMFLIIVGFSSLFLFFLVAHHVLLVYNRLTG